MKNILHTTVTLTPTLLIGIIMSASPLPTEAKQLSPAEALERALGYTPAKGKPVPYPTRGSAADYTLSYTSPLPGDETKAGCYFFKSSEGFMVASADDRAVPVLAYGTDTTFDPDNMSPELKWWLSEYGREMVEVPDSPYQDEGITDPKEPIAPMCKTKWNQFGPYYDMCSKAYGEPVVTGCVATALAQVMKYHNWPPTGEGERTYTSAGKEFSFDYSTADFKWNLMLDSYWAKAPEDTKEAVAELMYACGVAVGMHYHPGGSGADPAVMCGTLPEYLKYDRSIYNAQRMYYGIQDWTDLIYNQLKTVGPVQYSGYVSSGGGHSFVCDGYDQNGYFHFNWGWGGASDGYYLLTSLSPTHRGVGPAEARGGFNFNQDAVINIFPAGSTPSTPYYGVMNASNFHIGQKWAYTGREITVTGAYWNTGATEIKGQFGVEAIAENGTKIIMPGRVITDYWANEGLGGYSAQIPEDIPVGKYTVVPVFKYNGEWLPIRTAVNSRGSEKMTVEADGSRFKAVFSTPEKTGSVTAVDLVVKNPEIDPKHYSTVTATMQNTTEEEWIGAVAAGLFTKDNKLMSYGMRMELDIPASTEQPLTYSSEMRYTVLPDSLHDGPATLYLIDYYSHKPISAGIPVTITGEASSGIDNMVDINRNPEGFVTVYNLQGMRVAGGNYPEVTAALAKGVYILADSKGNRRKVVF